MRNEKEGRGHNLVEIFNLGERYGQIFIGGIKQVEFPFKSRIS